MPIAVSSETSRFSPSSAGRKCGYELADDWATRRYFCGRVNGHVNSFPVRHCQMGLPTSSSMESFESPLQPHFSGQLPSKLMRYAVRSTGIARPERPEASRAGARRRGKTQFANARRLGCPAQLIVGGAGGGWEAQSSSFLPTSN
jgi:hypothetical protein